MRPAIRLVTLLQHQQSYAQKVMSIAPANLIALWPLSEASGTTAFDVTGHGYNGTYTTDSGSFTLGQTGIGDGGTAPLFNPAIGTRVPIYSAAIAAAFNGQEGTMLIWFKVRDVSVLSDGTGRYTWLLAQDGPNQINFTRAMTNNQYQFLYNAAGSLKTIVFTNTTLTWQSAIMTWSKSGDAMKGFINGSQVGTTQTGLGSYTGSLNGTANAKLGQGGATWDGYLALAALWNTPLNQTQITALATVS